MRQVVRSIMLLATLTACVAEDPAPVAIAPASRPASVPTRPPADPRTDPEAAFAAQYACLRERDLEGVEAYLISELRGRVDPEILAAAADRLGTLPVFDLAARFEASADEARVFAKNGRVLTTLVRRDGRWLVRELWWRSDAERR